MRRNYIIETAIAENYKKARKFQTLAFVKKMHQKYIHGRKKIGLTIWDALKKLDEFIDVSDPDIELPNSIHAFQSAEMCRKDGQPDWFILTCLIHDLGKILFMVGCDEDGTSLKEQWAIVGDTFVVGAPLSSKCVYPEFNSLHPDTYDTTLGIYPKHIGMQNVYCSFGHDEYLYQILQQCKHSLPIEALYMIRFHSLYPYHMEGEYKELMNAFDEKMLPHLQKFNQYDLYSKENSNIEIDETFYKELIDRYFQEKIIF